jgi:RHS repeat-associated protein
MRRVGRGSGLPKKRAWLLSAVIFVLVVGIADPAEAAPGGHFSRLSVAGWKGLLESPAWTGVPEQPSGARPHGPAGPVSGSKTRIGSGSGRKPGTGEGALPEYKPYTPKVTPGRSGKAGGGRFDAKTSKMDRAKSSANVTLFDNADGSITRNVSEFPVNYRTSDGTWSPIDTTLAQGSDGQFAETANSMDVTFAPQSGGTDDMVKVVVGDGQSVGYSLQGAADTSAEVDGATASYRQVLPHTTLTETAGPTGVKEGIVLDSPAAGNSWTFDLHTAGLTAGIDKDGGVTLADAKGAAAGRIPLPYAYDSKVDPHTGDPATTWSVKYALAGTSGDYQLTVTVDAAWLADSARVFPVTVDPTMLSTKNTVSTTYTTSDGPGDFSSDTMIKTGECVAANCGGTDTKAVGLVKIPTFPDLQGYVASSASLVLFNTWTAVASGTTGCTPSNPSLTWSTINVAPITQAWSVPGAKAYPGPSKGASIGSAAPATFNACTNTANSTGVGDWVTVPITDLTFLNDWSFGIEPDYGFAVYGATGSLTWRKYDSDVFVGVSPYLSITYADHAPQVNTQYPPNGYQAPTLTPELMASATKPSDSQSSAAITYDFKVYNDAGTVVVDSTPLAKGDYVVPTGKLKWGTTYYWTVTADDGILPSVPKPAAALTPTVPQPVITSSLSQDGNEHGFDPANGNYTLEETDAQVATVGPSLDVVRDYNSRDPRTAGAFGAAWSSVFDAQLVEQKNTAGAVTSVTVTYPDGSQVGFGKNSDGTFSPPPGRYATLRTAVSPAVGYTLTDKNDTVYTFGTSLTGGAYGISAVADASGRTVTFTRTAGQVTTMTSAVSGRALHLTWSTPSGATSAHVTSVATDPATVGDSSTVETWKYNYSGDRLTEVCDPEHAGCTNVAGDAATRYTYADGSQYGSAVLDADAHSYWPLSEAGGSTAASSVLVNEHNDDATYGNVTLGVPGPTASSAVTAASFDGSSSLLQLPSNLVATASFQSFGLWFKTTSPGVLLSYQAAAVTPGATTPANYTPAMYVGSSGKLNAEFWNGSGATPLVSTGTVNDGKWHYALLSAAGDTQTLFVDGVAAGSPKAGTIVPVVGGTLNEYVGAGYWGGGWPDQPHHSTTDNTGYASFFNGSIADVQFYTQPLVAADVKGLYYAATANGHLNAAGLRVASASLLTQVTRPSGKTDATVTYDPATARVSQVVDDNGGTWALGTPTVSGTSETYRSAVMGSGVASYHRLADYVGVSDAYSETDFPYGGYNNVTLGVPGPFPDRTAASFDGTSSYVSMPASEAVKTGPNSVELWFNMPAGSTDGGVLFGQMGEQLTSSTPEAHGWDPALYVGTDGRLHGELWMGAATKALASGSLVNDGKWHHAVIAAGTNSQTLYLDGNAAGTLAGALVDPALTNVYVGAGESDGGWPFHPTNTLGYFKGSIAEVAFYHSQLSAAQVAAHYAAYGSATSSGSPTQINTVVDPGGKTETYRYDASNGDRLISQTDGAGATRTYGYDTSGFLYTLTDPNGDVTTTAHDVRGNVVSQTTCQDREDQACSTDYYTYWPDDTTAILTTNDPRNDLVTSARDGRSASATDPTYATTYTYNTAGDRISTTTPPVPGFPSGRTTTETYSDGTAVFPAADSGNVPKGLPMTAVSPGGATVRTAYFHNGDVASKTDANGLVTLYGYDNLGQVTTKTVNPGGPVGWWKLNQSTGTTVADSAGVGNGATASNVTWSGGVGVFNGTSSEIVSPAPALNTSTSFTMSAWANLSKIPTGFQVVMAQRGANNTAAELTFSPDTGSWKFQTSSADVTGGYVLATASAPTAPVVSTWYHLVGTYDSSTRKLTLYVNGTPVATATAAGTWTGAKNLTIGSAGGRNFFPGSLGNVQVYQRPLSAAEITTLFNSGRAGTAVATTTPNGLVSTAQYDRLGQVISETDPTVTNRVTGAAHTATTTTVYDPDGNATSQTVADSAAGGDASRTVSNTYNQYEQLATSTDARGNVTSKTYDPSGNVATETSPNGDVTAYTYDADNRMLTQSLSNFTGDPANPVGAHSQLQLTKVYDAGGRVAIQYDAMNNATEFWYTDNGLLAKAVRERFDSNDQVTDSFTLENNVYDPAGNLTEKDTANWATATKSTYDAADRPTKTVLDPTGENRATTVAYTPDDGVATSNETDGRDGDRTTSFTYDAMGNQLSASVGLDGTGHPVGWYRLNESRGTAVTDASGTGNTAVATGVTWTGTGAKFAGTAGQQVATNGPVLTTTAPYSVSAWVNLAAAPSATEAVVSQDGKNAPGFSLQYNSADHGWAFAQSVTDTAGATTLRAHASTIPAAGTWYHLVGTYDSSSGAMKLYVNGGAIPGTPTNSAPFAATGATAIGRDKAGNLLNGTVANVQIYNRVLSQAEVTTLFNAGQSGGTVASSSQNTTTWARDIRGLPTSQTDPDGNTTDYTYDEAGQLAVTVAPAVSAETYGSAAVQVRPVATAGYDTFGEQTQSQDPDGNIVNTVYDAEGNRVSQTLPNYTPPGSSTPITATTVWAYDKEGQLLSEQDPLGHSTAYTYDQLGDVATQTAADGGLTHQTYDLIGEPLTVTDASGAQSESTYDFMGRQVTGTMLERYPSTRTLTTNYSYASSLNNPGGGNLASVTSPDGATTSYTYDWAGRKIATTDPAGNTTSYGYTFLGDPSTTTNPDGTRTELQYDANQQVTDAYTYDHTGAVLTHAKSQYDAVGNLVSSTDPNGNTSTFTYDSTGALTQQIQPVSSTSSITTSFGYDPAGHRTRYTDGRGTNWYSTYNSWGMKETDVEPATTAYSSAADSTMTYAYDAAGRLNTQTLPGGVTQTFDYDAVGNLTSQQGSGASAATADRSFTYDKDGRILTAATSNTSGSGISNSTSESFSYDDRGDLLTASGTAGSTSLAYNGDGLVTSGTDASGTTTYGYDNSDRLHTVTDALTGTTQMYTNYNALNQVTQINDGTGDIRTFAYDDLHRLTNDRIQTPGGAAVASIGYGYDSNGNLTSKTTNGYGAATTNSYTYDQADRLTSWNNGTATVNYGYDAAGNRTQVGAKTFTYDARDQLTNDGTNGYSYTAAGVMSSQGGTTLTSDAYGQQSSDGSIQYTYDALGRMTQRGLGAGSQAMQYSGSGNLVANDGEYLYSRGPGGNLLGVRAASGGTAKLAITDQHSDVVGTMSAGDTALTQTTSYDPLGNVIGSRSTLGNLGYQSEYTDNTSGKVNMAARWYNPATGQFTSRDTAQNSASPNSVAANPFAYGDDDPLLNMDPSGHSVYQDPQEYVAPAKKPATKPKTTAKKSTSLAKVLKNVGSSVAHVIRSTAPKVKKAAAKKKTSSSLAKALKNVGSQVAKVVRATAPKVSQAAAAAQAKKKRDEQIMRFVGLVAGSVAVTTAAKIRQIAGGPHSLGISLSSIVDVLRAPGGATPSDPDAWARGFTQGQTPCVEDANHDCLKAGLWRLAAVATTVLDFASDAILFFEGGDDEEIIGDQKAKVVNELNRADGDEDAAATAAAGKAAAKVCGNSFEANTRVLMADGTTKPIVSVKIGDSVASTNPSNGKVVDRQVLALHDNVDTEMADVTIAGAKENRAVVHTTQKHPFWDVTTGQWTTADHLRVGDRLKSTGKAVLRVTAIKDFTKSDHRYNLTVADLHTYYVLAGSTPVLVHNDGGDDYNQAMNRALAWLDERGFVAERTTIGKFGTTAGQPIGMQTADGKTGFRVEFDERNGAHINVWSGKEKGPHFNFDASESTVTKLQGNFGCK